MSKFDRWSHPFERSEDASPDEDIDIQHLKDLRLHTPKDTMRFLRDCLPGHLLSSGDGDLSLFECVSHWQGPYLPPLDRHLIAVAQSPAVPCVTWLSREGVRRQHLQPGQIIFLPAGEPAYIRLGDPHRLLLLALRPCVLKGAASDSWNQAQDVPQAASDRHDGVIEGLAITMQAAALQGTEAATELADLVARVVARQLLVQHARAVSPERRRLGHARLEKVLAFLDENIAEPITLEDAARIAGCSVHHLAHLFKSEMGQSPMRYLNHKRMQKARELIENTRLSMGEIASLVGLSSDARFSQAFRAHWQTTPSALRRDA